MASDVSIQRGGMETVDVAKVLVFALWYLIGFIRVLVKLMGWKRVGSGGPIGLEGIYRVALELPSEFCWLSFAYAHSNHLAAVASEDVISVAKNENPHSTLKG